MAFGLPKLALIPREDVREDNYKGGRIKYLVSVYMLSRDRPTHYVCEIINGKEGQCCRMLW